LSDNEAVARDPVFWDRLGDVHDKAGLPDKTAEAWKKALGLLPKTADPNDRRKRELDRKLKAVGP
jgi:hypothetical protein